MNYEIIESNFIFALYKDPELYYDLDFKINSEYFTREDSKFYFLLFYNMVVKAKYNKIDEVSITHYLSDKPNSYEIYKNYGGFKTIKELMALVNLENFEKYKDELVKANIIKKLKANGFNVDGLPLNDMTSQDVYDYYEYIINETFLKVSDDTETTDFIIDENYIKEVKEGTGIGASISKALPRLNYDLSGIRTGEVGIVAASSGAGKSSFVFYNIVLQLIRQGIKYVLISNELTLRKFQDLMITQILFDELNYYGITRKKLKAGNLTPQDEVMLKEAIKINNEKYAPYLKFVKMFDYDINRVNKVIKKLAREGYSYFLFDTFKSEDSSDQASVGKMVEFSKSFFNLADKLNISIIFTQQVPQYKTNVRYMDGGCLAGSKQVVEIADFVIFLREVWDDEYADEKYDIKPFNFKKNLNGEYEKDENKHMIKEFVELNPDERNMIVFLSKNRNGESNKTYVLKHIGNYNVWKELGYCHVSHVNRY